MDCIIGMRTAHRWREFDGHESGNVGDSKPITAMVRAALYQASKLLTLFCKATSAVILFCLTGVIREIGDGWGGQVTAGFRGG